MGSVKDLRVENKATEEAFGSGEFVFSDDYKTATISGTSYDADPSVCQGTMTGDLTKKRSGGGNGCFIGTLATGLWR